MNIGGAISNQSNIVRWSNYVKKRFLNS
jgi:hypothetical protein